jgi:ATP-grasp domain
MMMPILLRLVLCFLVYCCQQQHGQSYSLQRDDFGVRVEATTTTAASYAGAAAWWSAAGWLKRKHPIPSSSSAAAATTTTTAVAASSSRQRRILTTTTVLTGLRAGGYKNASTAAACGDLLLGDNEDDDDTIKQQDPPDGEEDDSLLPPPRRPYIKYPSARLPPEAAAAAASAFGDQEGDYESTTRQQQHQEGSSPPPPPPPPPPSNKVRRALILMDAFCDYHGLYLANRILLHDDSNMDNDETAVIFVLSDYLRGYLLQTQPDHAATWQAMRLPWWRTSSNRAHFDDDNATTAISDDDRQDDDDDGQRSHLQQWTLGLEMMGVYCESDSGLQDAEELRRLLNVTTHSDNPHVWPARRDKYLQNEHLAKTTQLPVARQQLCSTIQQAHDFCQQLGMSTSSAASSASSASSAPSSSSCRGIVVKPCRGVASEDVKLCRDMNEVKAAFAAILGSPIFGASGRHEAVLLQEYLVGREYAVDVVCRQGEYKVAAVWRYDKRPNIKRVNKKNGDEYGDDIILADFCYYKTELVDAAMDANVAAVCDYVKQALQALGIRQGISHSEVIVTENDSRGPVLVEINCRQHNMDFIPLTMLCIGYNALDMTLTALLGSREEWDSFPDMAELQRNNDDNGRPCCRHGCMVHLVNSNAVGILQRVNHMDDISKLPSFFNGHVYPQFVEVGNRITPTIDIKSDAGWIQLVHEDEAQLEKDYQQILAWMPTMFDVDDVDDDGES